jgi:predicted methyltransferase
MSSPDMPAQGMGPPAAPAKPACDNITAGAKLAAEFALPAGLDLVWTSENYHDLHNPMFGQADMVKFNKVIFDALKPGGVYLVEDHAAQTGSGVRDTDTLHRIDPEQVKKEVTAAGFVLEGSSAVLINPADPLTTKPFDLNGKSSKFLLKFRKPAR